MLKKGMIYFKYPFSLSAANKLSRSSSIKAFKIGSGEFNKLIPLIKKIAKFKRKTFDIRHRNE